MESVCWLYDDFYTKIRLKQATGFPYLDLGIYFDIGLTVGYGFEVPLILDLGKYSKLYAGVNLKFLNRIKYEDDRLNAIVGMDEVMSIMEGKKGILMAQYLGMDIGAIFKAGKPEPRINESKTFFRPDSLGGSMR